MQNYKKTRFLTFGVLYEHILTTGGKNLCQKILNSNATLTLAKRLLISLKIYLITSKLLETTPVLLVSSRFKEFINLCYANLASLNLTTATSIRAVS